MQQDIKKIEQLVSEGLEKIQVVKNENELEDLRILYLGRKGLINNYFSHLKELNPDDKKSFGLVINQAKEQLEEQLHRTKKEIKQKELHKQLEKESLDVTLPPRRIKIGSTHILIQTIEEISAIFLAMGFCVAEGPEVETEYYNFDALNIPQDHPARDMHDTIYLENNYILRTHTSPVQIRIMEKFQPPISIICPGKAYRSDAIDASHSPMFHQIEGLMVDIGVSFSQLKQVLLDFIHQMFGESVQVRFRPSYFPFTEPSAEVDISCGVCEGKGCKVCSHNGWLEILGAGMVNPRVFEEVGFDPERYAGFAFGMGVERIAMLKYRIDDIRLFYENDLRFLEQF
ncbi:phenylalanine--tRNA ligase subunit alpha [Chlamydiota bacterium]